MDKSYRIHTNITSDTVLNVNMRQDFDFLEVLSLKLRQKDAYRLHSSNYGVIIGRVLANDAFGVPNAKVSVFIERDKSDSVDMENIYPYSEVTSKDKDGRRYNLLPNYSDDSCYRIVGTFPNKRLMLDDDIMLEVFDKYWKYTTVTNQSGDYMIFGVPSGSQQLHVDVDLSDIGVLSQKPRDFEYKGYNMTMFDNANQFKESTNIDNLVHIFSQNKSVFVYPFWGDDDNGIAAITRADMQIQYKFEPTCVFIGSIISDNDGHAIGHKCAASEYNGMNDQLVAGNGTIEMIRKTTDGLVEEYQIQGNQLINEDGVWCYQIPMNLDYIGTDEYGNIVPTDDPTKGIPTRTQVRFRISKNETNDEGFSRHTAKYLVPMNPIFDEKKIIPTIDVNGSEIEKMYNFGSATPDSCFRDLYWNNVYSVKNYIPKTQVASRPYSPYYSALKGSNLATDQNAVPFNKLRTDLPFMYMIVCILFVIIMTIIYFVNKFIIGLINIIIGILRAILSVWPLRRIASKPSYVGCIPMAAGLTEGNVVCYPGCNDTGLDAADCPDGMDGCKREACDTEDLKDLIQRKLALDFNIVKLDFYQDWINGTLYFPLWHWRKRKKKSFLFGLFSSSAKNEYCSCDKKYKRLRTYYGCNIEYDSLSLDTNESSMPNKESNWHRNRSRSGKVSYSNGLIKQVTNKDGLNAYYYVALQATRENANEDLEMAKREKGFYAIRLYATDIILLGNLNPNNLYGIPQFFKCLPPTTVNIPPIATVEDAADDEYENEGDSKSEATTDTSDSGITITTGMDWGHNGIDQSPQYNKGLFIDLECTSVGTKSKSCVNVERLSELGVNLDMSYDMPYGGTKSVNIGKIESDGFITKLELDDMENRAMFATMNHIGFIPQSCQDEREMKDLTSYQTQVNDENTNYLVNKFKYIYPVDFDGRLQQPMTTYKNGFEQAMFDEKDESYITFRLGAESNDNNSKNSEGRIRHFYKTKETKDKYYSMPLYNNSYYFYFGVNKGKTAIDKFNELFWADCYQNDKKPFTIVIDKQGKSYCPSAYKNKDKACGWIKATVDDIRTPYSYKLYDSNNNIVSEASDVTQPYFIIGGSAATVYDDVVCIDDGSKIVNQTYTLEITDSDGKTLGERITLDTQKIAASYDTERLGTKFYNVETTRIDYICNDNNGFYGKINMTGLTVDGYDCKLDGAEYIEYNEDINSYVFSISGSSDDIGSVEAILYVSSYNVDEDSGVRNCLCDANNPISNTQRASSAMKIDDANKVKYFFGFNENPKLSTDDNKVKMLQLFVYQPNKFLLTIKQICDKEILEENSSSEIIDILNGENFNTYLNTMPIKYMLGSTNDNIDANVSSNGMFYSKKTVESTSGTNISGWYGVHQEDSYMFYLTQNMVKEKNTKVWTDFLSLTYDINDPISKRKILKNKFDWMFKLSEGTYTTKDSSRIFRQTSTGGVSPILYRSVAPMYNGGETNVFKKYVLNDSNSVNTLEYYPNIVGNNYSGITSTYQYPSFNPFFDDNKYLGNYFGAFTKDGSYVAKNKIDGKNINIMRIPNYAPISPADKNGKTLKIKGKDINGDIVSKFKLARESGKTELTNDIKKDSNPYLRALSIDRRFDFNFVIFAPSMNSNFRLHSNENYETPWRSGRISGFTYNGIEMSYDENYNIISASPKNVLYYIPSLDETEENGTTIEEAKERAANNNKSLEDIVEYYDYDNTKPNNRLEYSYQYVSGETTATLDTKDFSDSTITIYNKGDKNSVWGSWNDGYDEKIDTDDKPLIKEFYEFNFAYHDMRHLLWSDFNSNRLSAYTTNRYGKDALFDSSNKYYVFNYPSTAQTSLYNGDFNRDAVKNGKSYPTRRFIDVGKITPSSTYDFNVSSCSYNITPTINDDDSIYCETKDGETFDFSINWETPINFVSPNADNKDYANVVLNKVGKNGDGYSVFSASTASLYFTYNAVSNNDFKIYTATPRLIQVLPYIGETNCTTDETKCTDGITYIKTANPGDEKLYADGKSLSEAINDVSFYTFMFPKSNRWAKIERDIILPDGIKFTGYFKKGDDYLSSDEEEFTNIIFTSNDIALKGAKAFSVLVQREYSYNDDDNLTRKIHTVETSEIFDTRDVLLKVSSATVEVNGEEIKFEYETNTITSSTDSDSKTYIQTIIFEMLFNNVLSETFNPLSAENQSFADYDMMSFTFKFTDSKGNKYYIDCDDITPIEDGNNLKLQFNVRWSSDMGILIDDKWKDKNPKVEMYAKTASGFTYKLNTFELNVIDSTKKESIEKGTTYTIKDVRII